MAYTRVNWENSPSIDTPINSDNLNIMDAGIAELDTNSIITSPTEPTGVNRKKYWFQKGKNLFNKDNVEIGYIDGVGAIVYNLDWRTSGYIPLPLNAPNITTSGGTVSNNAHAFYTENYTYISAFTGNNTAVVPATARYIRVTVKTTDLNVFQLEQNATATTYETYRNPKIWILNGNSVYSEHLRSSISQLSDDLTPRLGGNLDMNGKTINDITPTEIGYLDGLTGNIQSQINQRFRRVFYQGYAGNQNVDTGISANGGYGGRCYLGVITWHTSSGTATGTKIFVISCSYDAGTTSNYTVCDIKNSADTITNSFSTTAGGNISFVQTAPAGAFSYVSLYDLSNR